MSSLSKPGAAIVTGASQDIGKVYAKRLAARGHDLVLVARRDDSSGAVAADLQERFGVRAEVLVADLSRPDGVASVADRLARDAAVSLLVNNAGFLALKPLDQAPEDVLTGMIALNVLALTSMSRAALIAFKPRGAGTVVNIGSGAGIAPYPHIPVYGATKAYLDLFTRSLRGEAQGSGVRVQLVLPGAVVFEGWDVASAARDALPEGVVMTTEDRVDAALFGLDRGETVTAPSLQDDAALHEHQVASGALLQAMFKRAPASRYGIGAPRQG